MIKVNRYTRSSRKYGKAIYCPHCVGRSVVYHFAWSALQCEHCTKFVSKIEWDYVPEIKGKS